MLATTHKLSDAAVAAGMLGPWSQESFLKYMREQRERKAQRAAVDQHLPFAQVPEPERFDRLGSGRRDLVDTINLGFLPGGGAG